VAHNLLRLRHLSADAGSTGEGAYPMSDSKPTPEELAQQIMSGGPIVSQASQAVGKLFASIFDALSQNIETIIKTNQAPTTLNDAVNALTTDMIRVLRARVDGICAPDSKAAQDPTGSGPSTSAGTQ
jgi:hypothetical protein